MLPTIKKFLVLSSKKKATAITVLWYLTTSWIQIRVLNVKVKNSSLIEGSTEQSEGMGFNVPAHLSDNPPKPLLSTITLTTEALEWRFKPFANCLVKAHAIQRLLLSKGYSSIIKLGVNNDPDIGFNAHAWLEDSKGEIIIGEVPRMETLRTLKP